MDTRIAIHLVVTVLLAVVVLWGVKIFYTNMKASRENVQVAGDAKTIGRRMKKMLPWALVAAAVLVALNVLPILLFR